MSIEHAYDAEPAILNPEDILIKSEKSFDICIMNFSYKIMNVLLAEDLLELVDDKLVKNVAGIFKIYKYRGTNILVVQTNVGAPITAGLIEEIGYTFSCKHFILFGSCGGLDNTIPSNKLIVPTYAYRDEGMSYHYMPKSDYIKIRNHEFVSYVLDKLNVPYAKGRTWTTDAFFRETRPKMEQRKKEGCIAVEMEVSACQAVANFNNYDFYNFLYRADNLDNETWEAGTLSSIDIDERLKHFNIALEIAKEIEAVQNALKVLDAAYPNIKLIKPTLEYADDIMAMRQELLEANDEFGYFAGCGGLEEFTNAESWIEKIQNREFEENCPDDKVPSTVYIAVRISDNKIVGIIDIRHHINHPILSTWGGHSGYVVRPSERGKGYGKEMLRLNIENYKDLGFDKVMITCDERNIASEKVIVYNGGVFDKIYEHDGIRTKIYWISLI